MYLRSNFLFKIRALERLERWAPMALWGNFLLTTWASEGDSLGGVAAGALPEASSGWVDDLGGDGVFMSGTSKRGDRTSDANVELIREAIGETSMLST